jgi:hypothetical protein
MSYDEDDLDEFYEREWCIACGVETEDKLYDPSSDNFYCRHCWLEVMGQMKLAL